MTNSMRRAIWAACLLGAVITAAACGDGAAAIEDDELGDELPPDGKNDSLTKPTAHGFIPFARLVTVPFAAKAQVHAYDFGVDGDVRITFDVASNFDAALYLYRAGADGRWKKVRRVLSRALPDGDEGGGGGGGDLTAALGTGRYRVIVKSMDGDASGNAMARLDCSGSGCPDAQCLFGEVLDDATWDEHSLLRVAWVKEIYEEDAAAMSSVTRAQFLAATDTRSVADAFAETDEGVFTLSKLEDTLTGKNYYWIGFHHVADWSSETFFRAGQTTPAAVIGEDGIVGDCDVFW